MALWELEARPVRYRNQYLAAERAELAAQEAVRKRQEDEQARHHRRGRWGRRHRR